MAKKILFAVIFFIAGVATCFAWFVYVNPRLAKEALPFMGNKQAMNPRNVPQPSVLTGIIESVNGKELTVKLNIFGKTEEKKIKLPDGVAIMAATQLTEKELWGKFYDQIKAAQEKLKKTLTPAERLAAVKTVSDLQAKADKLRIDTVVALTKQLTTLKPEQEAEKKALQEKIQAAMTTVKLEAMQAAAIKAGQNLVVYLKAQEDLSKQTIEPTRIDIIR
ncbi:MAG: hypothetical protein WCO55_02275 [Candidatus Falkowbacteria bacterium]